MSTLPDYLSIGRHRLGEGQTVKVDVIGDAADLAAHMAQAMLAQIKQGAIDGTAATLIVPVGPVDQFPLLAGMINDQRIDCRDVVLINMDEYLTDDDELLGESHPLSLIGFMKRQFYERLDPQLAPHAANRVIPDPHCPEQIDKIIAQRGGVDVCFGGIGINGHIAFNEPPEPGVEMQAEAFAALPTRCLDVSRETRTINSNTIGGEITIVPRRCITVGMRQILAARQLRFYCNRPWQSAVVRRVLHGPITPACPASFLRTHHDASITVTDFVAEPPDVRLR